MLGFPIKHSGDVASPRLAAPELGEHSIDVLLNLGFQADEIKQLLLKQIIKQYNADV